MNKRAFSKHLKSTFKYLLILTLVFFTIIGISIPLAKYIKPNDLLLVDNQTDLTINNVNLLTMSDAGFLANQQLVIHDGIIQEINPVNTDINKNGRVIDAMGAFVIPGLFDMHVHLSDQKHLMLSLALGVTSVRAMGGTPESLRWKKSLKKLEWLGSNLYLSSPILDGSQAHLFNQSVISIEQGQEQVRKAKIAGYDLIKVYGYLNSDVFDAIVDEARTIDIPVAKHAPHPVQGSNWKALEQLQSLEHVEDIFQGPLEYKFDYEQLNLTAQKLHDLNIPVVPTLATFDQLTRLSNDKQEFIDTLPLDYINPLHRSLTKNYRVDRWLADNEQQSQYHIKKREFLFDIVRSLYENDVKLLIGSDAGTLFTLPGFATHDEMLLFHQAGIPNFEILKAATINAAKALKVQDRYGSIEVGKVADLVLLSRNPLNDISSLKDPYAVIKNGQWLSGETLEQLKVSAKNTSGYYWSTIRLLEDLLSRSL